MNERRNYFAKRKENVPPTVSGDTEWGGVACILPWWGISDSLGVGLGCWGLCCQGGLVGELSTLMGAAFTPCFPTHKKIEI